MGMFKGWRTVLVGLVLAIGPEALQYLSGIDWNALIGTKGAFLVSGLVTIALRGVTTGPVGSKTAG